MKFENQTKGTSLKQSVYKQLFSDILSGVYLPESVITEKELVERFGISKSPIREALIELCNEKIVRSIPRYGYEVLRITEKDIRDAKETRILVETGALSLYFDKITKEDISRLRDVLNIDANSEIDILKHWERNSKFHLALMEIYGNQFLIDLLESTLNFMARAYVQYQYNRYQQMKFQGKSMNHRKLLDAIEKGEKEEAIAILSADIGNFETSFLVS